MRTIGAFDLGDFAQTLENAAKAGDKKTLDAHMEELFARCRKLSERMSVIKSDGFSNSEKLPELSEQEVDAVFEKLLAHVENYEFENIEEQTEILKSHHLPESRVEKAKTVCRMVDNFDYDQIAELLKE